MTDAVVMAFSGILVLTLLMIIASFPVGLYVVFGSFGKNLSNSYTAASPTGSLAWDAVFFVLQIPVAATLGTLFAGVSLVYFLFLVLAGRQGPGFVGAIRSARREGFGALLQNPLAGTLVFLGATSLATVALDTLQTGAGVPTGSVSGDPFALLIDFAVAPLLEETTFRLVMIGVPVAAVLLVARGSLATALRCLWRPSAAWDSKIASPIRSVAYAFLVISSLLFGYAHYAANSGWEIGKISEAALGGLALGYVYIRYGFHTGVLLHWSIDYVGSVYSFLGQAVWGVPWTSSTGSLLDVVPGVLMIFVLGLPSLLIVLNEILKPIIRRSSGGVGDDSSGQVNPL